MEDKKNQMKKSSSLSLPSPENGSYDEEKQSCGSDSPSKTSRRKPGGWRAMPYVLGDHLLSVQKPFFSFKFDVQANLHANKLFLDIFYRHKYQW